MRAGQLWVHRNRGDLIFRVAAAGVARAVFHHENIAIFFAAGQFGISPSVYGGGTDQIFKVAGVSDKRMGYLKTNFRCVDGANGRDLRRTAGIHSDDRRLVGTECQPG
jgi:hypothetical protein